MASISHRTRSRRSGSSVCTPRRRHAAAPPPIIVIDDDDDDVVDEEAEAEASINVKRNRFRASNAGGKCREDESAVSWDRKGVVLADHLGIESGGSEESVKFEFGKDVGFADDESEASVKFEEEELQESVGDGEDLEWSDDDDDVIFVEEAEPRRCPLHAVQNVPVEEANANSFEDKSAYRASRLHSVKDELIDNEEDVGPMEISGLHGSPLHFVKEPVSHGKPSPSVKAEMVEEEAEDEVSMRSEREEPVAMPSGPCIARITRIQAGKKRHVSSSEYFKEKFSDDYEEKEEDEDKDASTGIAGGIGENDEVIVKKKKRYGIDDDVIAKRKKRYGIDILVSASNVKSGGPVSSGITGVSQRTRSHFNSMRGDKLKRVGMVRKPCFIDVDNGEDEDVVGEGNRKEAPQREKSRSDNGNRKEKEERSNASNGNRVDDNERKQKDISNDSKEYRMNADESEQKEGNRMNVDEKEQKQRSEASNGARTNVGAEEESVEVCTLKKRKRSQILKNRDLFEVLAETILNEGETLPEVLVDDESRNENEGASCHENVLPVLFSFGDDDPRPVEKTEYEKEIDQLWADFDFAMEANNIGVYHDDEVQKEDIHVESDPSTLCSNGKHQCIFDEQIGIRCKFCPFVELEIKYIFPSWASHARERFSQKENLNKEDPFFFNKPFASEKVDVCHGLRDYSTGTVWDVIQGFTDNMFQHQQEAFEFMWRNLAGSIRLDELKADAVASDSTGGCVISHAPGTGKTRLTIVFVKSYMQVFPECRPVIVAPRGLMQTWQNEFKKWKVNILIHNLNDREYLNQEDHIYCNFVKCNSVKSDVKLMRLVKLWSWDKGNGIILLSYNLFAKICSSNDARNSQLKKILLEKPDLIIFDEGHTPRNERSQIWKTVEKIKTCKRVILSGTPFQNNFTELYNTLCLVRPKFAQKISSRTTKLGQAKRAEFFSNKEDKPEKIEAKSRWDCLTKSVNADSKELKTCIEEVKSIIEPFVHVHNGKILDTLPGLRKCIVVLDPLPQQEKILEKMKEMRSNCSFESDFRNSLVSIHPSLAMTFLSEKERSLVDTPLLEKVRLNPYEGAKTTFVIELVRLCKALKEKVIVFCQYIEPLDMIKNQLIKLFDWSEGTEILKMDGQTHTQDRQRLIDAFNDFSNEAKVLVASTKACSEGISLVGASRVVLLDILWNPAMEYQAISRAHRIGQRKFVHIYQLITFGTGDGDKYVVQATKDKMSKLVFSPEIDLDSVKENTSRTEKQLTLKLVAEDKVLVEMTRHDGIKDMFRKIIHLKKESINMHVLNEDDITSTIFDQTAYYVAMTLNPASSSTPPNEENEKCLWKYVTKDKKTSEGGGNVSWKCNYCKKPFTSSYTCVKYHLLQIKGKGIGVCAKIPDDILKKMTREDQEEQEKERQKAQKLVPLPPKSESRCVAKKRKGIGGSSSDSGSLSCHVSSPIANAFNLERDILDKLIARALYSAGLPFTLARNPYWRESYAYACNHNLAGYVSPGFNILRITLLQQEKANIQRLLQPIQEKWNEKGVSIVSDSWSDSQRRPLINFMAVMDG